MKPVVVLLLAALAGTAAAGQREDYAEEWPLQLAREDGGAFRVVLSAALYRAAQRTDLGDIEVFNAAGVAVPATLLGPEAAAAQDWPRETVDLPWFLLPPVQAGAAADWALRAERDASGRVLRIDATLPGSGSLPAAPELLLDLSQVKRPLVALRLRWSESTPAFHVPLLLSGSDDLQQWRRLGTDMIADLRNEAERLRRDRVELTSAQPFRYLRLAATDGAVLPTLLGVSAEIAPPPQEPEWRWLELAGQAEKEGELVYYRYTLDARIPAQQLDVRAAADNSVANWRVLSREQPQRPWLLRAGPWTGYRVASAEAVERSSPQRLTAPLREREWRVEASQAQAAPPTLLLAYRPEALVFLAQGPGPYTMAAGSARARRQDAPIGTLLDALRRRHGADWKPFPATPGVGRELGGAAALAAPAQGWNPDWRGLLLWGVLVLGTLLVVIMAFTLLRERRPADPGQPRDD